MGSVLDVGVAGQPLSTPPLTAWQKAVRDALDSSDVPVNTRLKRPRVGLTLAAQQTLTATSVACTWAQLSTEAPHDPGLWSAAQPTRLTAPTPGVYELTMTLRIDMSTPGTVGVTRSSGEVLRNGATRVVLLPSAISPGGGVSTAQAFSQTLTLTMAAGEWLTVALSSTGTGWLVSAGQAASFLTWRRLQ